MAKFNNPNAYDGQQGSGVGKNSLSITSSDLVTKASGVVDKAEAGESIFGLSYEKTTFASDNQTVAKDRCQYYLTGEKDYIELPVSGETITFSGALVTSNTINLKVNGVAMTEVTFATSDANTLGLIATQLTTDFPTLIAAAAAGTNSVKVTPVTTNGSVVITDVVVAGGAGQATATVTLNTVLFTDEEKFYDITTTGQSLNYHSAHATSGQVQLKEAKASGTIAVVKVANT